MYILAYQSINFIVNPIVIIYSNYYNLYIIIIMIIIYNDVLHTI